MTVIFDSLRDGSTHQGTVTSMEPNEDTFILHGETTKKGKIKPVHIVDVPGHSRLRPKLDEYLPQAAGIVFVVDALDFLPNCCASSEYLYDLLTKGSVVRKKIPLLILCNKTDKVTAHTKEFRNVWLQVLKFVYNFLHLASLEFYCVILYFCSTLSYRLQSSVLCVIARQTVKSCTAILKAICTSFQETHKPSIYLIPDIWKQMSMCQHYYMQGIVLINGVFH
ncbi:signal recognition particle receptor subunit beta [Trifolium repens]|nr:signal recognition particle receptor subunit beta [Trifolium repens]